MWLMIQNQFSDQVQYDYYYKLNIENFSDVHSDTPKALKFHVHFCEQTKIFKTEMLSGNTSHSEWAKQNPNNLTDDRLKCARIKL